VRDGVLWLHPTHSGTEGPEPGFPPTLIDKSQGFFILHTTIDSSTHAAPGLVTQLGGTAESPKNYNYNGLQL
jgi:hypothetical protein